MPSPEKIIDKLKPADLISSSKDLVRKEPLVSFDSFMQSPKPPIKPPLASPFDLANSLSIKVSPENLANQLEVTQNSLKDVRQKLETEDLSLKEHQEKLIEKKLSAASEHLHDAEEKLGMESPPLPNLKDTSLMNRALQYIIDGIDRVERVKIKVHEMGKDPTNLQPGKLMLAQLEMAQALHHIEYASVFLSNAVTGLKSVVNTQI